MHLERVGVPSIQERPHHHHGRSFPVLVLVRIEHDIESENHVHQQERGSDQSHQTLYLLPACIVIDHDQVLRSVSGSREKGPSLPIRERNAAHQQWTLRRLRCFSSATAVPGEDPYLPENLSAAHTKETHCVT